MKTTFLDFEQPIAELENKIEELRYVQDDSVLDISEEIERLQKKSQELTRALYAKLSPAQVSQVARHPQRPYSLDYIGAMFTDFHELHGDRAFADDAAIVGGLARFNGQAVVVIGHQKGRDTKEKLLRNFGMPRPEGYRKALRLMKLAEKFSLPVMTFIDTPGAYPGIGAEERGQSEAIGRNLYEMAKLRVPVICTVIGTAHRLKSLGLVDRVVNEPAGGAHRDHAAMMVALKRVLQEELKELQSRGIDELLRQRFDRLMDYGRYKEEAA